MYKLFWCPAPSEDVSSSSTTIPRKTLSLATVLIQKTRFCIKQILPFKDIRKKIRQESRCLENIRVRHQGYLSLKEHLDCMRVIAPPKRVYPNGETTRILSLASYSKRLEDPVVSHDNPVQSITIVSAIKNATIEPVSAAASTTGAPVPALPSVYATIKSYIKDTICTLLSKINSEKVKKENINQLVDLTFGKNLVSSPKILRLIEQYNGAKEPAREEKEPKKYVGGAFKTRAPLSQQDVVEKNSSELSCDEAYTLGKELDTKRTAAPGPNCQSSSQGSNEPSSERESALYVNGVKKYRSDCAIMLAIYDFYNILEETMICKEEKFNQCPSKDWQIRKGKGSVAGDGMNGKVIVVHSLVYQDISDEFMAMKQIKTHPKNLDDDIEFQFILNELNVLKDNTHNNLLGLKGFRFYEETAYLFTPLMDCNIAELRFRKQSGLQENMVVHIILEALEGLLYMHNQLSRFHGDIKPGNIMLSLIGEVKLIDFGFSFLVQNQPKRTDDCPCYGTSLYLAPELIKCLNSEKSDVWALGVTLFEMLSPYKGKSEKYSNYFDCVGGGVFVIDPDKRISLCKLKECLLFGLETKAFTRATRQELAKYQATTK